MKILIIIIIISFIFLFLNHPLTFGIIILIQTILIRLFTGSLTFNFWFSYILFLIIIGGILILFIYITRIASNEKFKFSYPVLFIIFRLILTIIILIFINDYYFNDLNLNIINLINQNQIRFTQLSLTKFTNWPNYLIIYTIILYLLITLIIVVKVTKLQYGPLRQIN